MTRPPLPTARREFLKFLAASPYVAAFGGVAAFLQQDSFGQEIRQSTFAQIMRDRLSVIEDPAEALTVVLIQFDLTFRWTDAGAAIELLPIPEQVSIERKHHSKLKPADAMSLIRQRFPDAIAERLMAVASDRNLASPISVRGCFSKPMIDSSGEVTTLAPASAHLTICKGLRMDAARISVS